MLFLKFLMTLACYYPFLFSLALSTVFSSTTHTWRYETILSILFLTSTVNSEFCRSR